MTQKYWISENQIQAILDKLKDIRSDMLLTDDVSELEVEEMTIDIDNILFEIETFQKINKVKNRSEADYEVENAKSFT